MSAVYTTSPCFICCKTMQLGHHRYDGVGVPKWGVVICSSCKRHNSGGVVSRPDLLERMEERGIVPEYNTEGHIVIPT